MPQLLEAIHVLIHIFEENAKEDGDIKTLSKKELAKLLKKEFNMPESGNQAEIDEHFKALDADSDGVVDFTEYITLVSSMASCIATMAL